MLMLWMILLHYHRVDETWAGFVWAAVFVIAALLLFRRRP
jgi:hypothetical protein